MLHSEPMEKIRIICLEDDKRDVIASLHKLGAIELRKSDLQLMGDTVLEHSPIISDMLIKTDGALQSLTPTPIKHEKYLEGDELLALGKNRMGIADQVYKLVDSRKQLEEEKTALTYANGVAKTFSGVRVDFGAALKSNVLEYRAFTCGRKAAKDLHDALKKMRIENEATAKPLEKDQLLIFIAYEKGKSIDEVIKTVKVNEIDLRARYLDGTPAQVLERTTKALHANENELKKIAEELSKISKSHYSELAALREMLQIEFQRSEASTMFKKTDKTSIIEGWIPKKQSQNVKSSIEKATSGRYDLEQIRTKELAPTFLNRPKIFKPFDFLMNFYSTPRSDEIDPTWIFIISFPIFYGLMLSDVGYGILSLLFVTWVAGRTNPEGLVHNTAKIWQLTSISAIFFGILSNQYFGVGLNQYFIPGFKGFDWFTNVTSLIVVTILFGLVQVGLGFLLGAINSMHHGHKRHAVSKLLSIVVLISGTLAISGAFFSAIPSSLVMPTAAVAIAALLGTIIATPSEATEITSLITHPLSYSRIMGFGLASVIIAFLIDKAFLPNPSLGIPLFIVYLIIFSILHFLNMILGIFEGAVQSARLNFVEFFTKFYSGGGIKFNPFSYKRVYTKE